MSDISRPGDARYPTIRGTIFVGVFLALVAALLNVWQRWGIWPWVGAAIIFLYLVVANLFTARVNRHRERSEAVMNHLIARNDDDG